MGSAQSPPGVRSISIVGLHGVQSLAVDFSGTLNVVFGGNGTGKTTLLHVLANLLDRDIERFCYIKFHRIVLQTTAGDRITLESAESSERPAITVFINEKRAGTVGPESDDSAIREELRAFLSGRPMYFPAFRSVLEATRRARPSRWWLEEGFEERYWTSPDSLERELQGLIEHEVASLSTGTRGAQAPALSARTRAIAQATAYKTFRCREWFGRFVPTVRYPSLREVEDELRQELERASLEVARKDQVALSEVFTRVFETLLQEDRQPVVGDTKVLLERVIKGLTSLDPDRIGLGVDFRRLAGGFVGSPQQNLHLERELAPAILKIYDEVLSERRSAEEGAFQRLRTFQNSINRFLENKELEFILGGRAGRHEVGAVVHLTGGGRTRLGALSSGERHVLTLLFAATHMSSSDGVILIDEPELSLHVDWQRVILDELTKQAGDRQVIACTHAPEVLADHRDQAIRLEPQGWNAQPGLFTSADVGQGLAESSDEQ